MFRDPQLLPKLAANPSTAPLLADASFMAKLQELQTSPQASAEFLSDPRMIQVLGVLLGIDTHMGGEAPPGYGQGPGAPQEDEEMPDLVPEPPKPAKAAPEPESEPADLGEDAAEKKKAKEAAEKEKALGTENYKKRNFDAAITHYGKAWELHKDITYLNNLGAVYLEKGEYQNCIDQCIKAVEEGRQIYADFKTIAKSYARIGTAYEKMGDMANAVDNYQKSLTEHRTGEVVNKLRAAERRKIEEARVAYVDPAKAEEAREEGNKKFKDNDWPGAVAAYGEMIKRAPDDPRGYSNRAAAFMKLLELPSALEDCEMAIKKDAKFIRAYIRRAQVFHGMREYSKAVDACEEAKKVDAEHHSGANEREIESQIQKAYGAMYSARENETEDQTRERLMRDPEVRATRCLATGVDTFLTCTDYGHHAGSGYAVDLAAGADEPGRPGGAHEEPGRPVQDQQAGGGRCYSRRTMSQPLAKTTGALGAALMMGSTSWRMASRTKLCRVTTVL
jgi:stress-induced-phosphoprotein 1